VATAREFSIDAIAGRYLDVFVEIIQERRRP
jgi:hypothetical protein